MYVHTVDNPPYRVRPRDTEIFDRLDSRADQGHAGAQNNLGFMYENGLGVEQNHGTAVAWYQKAADQGDAAAQNNLDFMYKLRVRGSIR